MLRQERFPAIAPRSDESRLILSQLQYRHSLVKARTALANQLQALARSFGLAKFRMDTKLAEPKMLAATDQAPLQELIESRFRLFRRLSEEIAWLEKKLAVQAHSNAQVQLLMTHPGIGDKTGLAIVHTLGDIGRFRRAGEVAAFVGLVPLDKSSGQKKRIGKTSKMGPKLLRYLLGQAAHRSFADERLDEFYQRVSRRRGKPKAKVATARKLLERCYLMLRDNISYEEFRRRGEVGLPDCPVKESAG